MHNATRSFLPAARFRQSVSVAGFFSMAELCTRISEPSSPKLSMSKTTSSKQGRPVEYWPGTSIVKSTGNAFTAKFDCVMSTPQELAKVRAQEKSEKARATQIERSNGFGGNSLKGLSKKAREQLANVRHSPPIAKAGSGSARHAKTKASI